MFNIPAQQNGSVFRTSLTEEFRSMGGDIYNSTIMNIKLEWRLTFDGAPGSIVVLAIIAGDYQDITDVPDPIANSQPVHADWMFFQTVYQNSTGNQQVLSSQNGRETSYYDIRARRRLDELVSDVYLVGTVVNPAPAAQVDINTTTSTLLLQRS